MSYTVEYNRTRNCRSLPRLHRLYFLDYCNKKRALRIA